MADRVTIASKWHRIRSHWSGRMRTKQDVIDHVSPGFDDLFAHDRSAYESDDPVKSRHVPLGADGLVSMRTAIYSTLFPSDQPWWEAVRVPFAGAVGDDLTGEDAALDRAFDIALQRMVLALQQELMAPAIVKDSPTGYGTGFLEHKSAVIDQLLLTGMVLEEINDDLVMRRWPLSQFVVRLNSHRTPVQFITWEDVDPETLTPEERRAAEVNLIGRSNDRPRPVRVYREVWWDYARSAWMQEEEANGKPLGPAIDIGRFPNYFYTDFGTSTSRQLPVSYFESAIADLRAIYVRRVREGQLVDVGTSKFLAVGPGASTTFDAEQLTKTPGTVVTGLDVANGQAQSIAWIGLDTSREVAVVGNSVARIESDLARRLLIPGQQVRDSERTTVAEIFNITVRQLNATLGGALPFIADKQHRPLAEFMLRREIKRAKSEDARKILDELLSGEEGSKIRVQVAEAGIQRSAQLEKFAAFMNVLSTFIQVDGAMPDTFDRENVINQVASWLALDPQGLMLSPKQRQAIQEERRNQQEADQLGRAVIEQSAQGVREIAVQNARQQNA